MNLLRFVSALLLLSVSAFGQAVDYRALGTNSYYTNGLRVNDKHWTNSAGLYRYQPLTGTVAAGQPGPPLVLRSDGSAFVGTNVFQDVTPTAAGVFFPYVISMTDSNEANTVNADWWAIDSENYGVYGGASLDVQQAGSSLFRLSADTGPSSTLLRLNSTPGASDILLNENTDRFLASANATNVVMANAVGQNWLYTGQTNGTSTIRTRADGSTFVGPNVDFEASLSSFTTMYSPISVSVVESNNQPATLRSQIHVINNANYDYESMIDNVVFGNKDTPYAYSTYLTVRTNGNNSSLKIGPQGLGSTEYVISLTTNSVQRFSVQNNGNVDYLRGVTYSWPVWDGDAVGNVLTTTNAAGALDWQPGILSTAGTNIILSIASNAVSGGSASIGPGTNNYYAKFDSTGTNVVNSPTKSAFTNSIEHFLLPNTTGTITFTNGATTNRMYAMWAHANTNSYLEFVSPPPFSSQWAHIRAQTTGFTSQRPGILLNDSVVVEPVDNPLGGHAVGALYPIVSGLGTLGTPVLLWHGVYSDTNGFAAQARNDQVLFSDGAAKGFGISTAGALYLTGPAFVGIQFNQDKVTGSPQFDLGASQLGFGSTISNSIAQLQESTLVGYVQVGTNNANTATARAQGIIAARASGTDRPGSDLLLAAGMGTGNAISPRIRFQSSNPGSTGSGLNNTLIDRMIIDTNTVTIYSNLVVNGTITAGGAGGGGLIMTNQNVNAFVLFTNNNFSGHFSSAGVFTLTNFVANELGFSVNTNGVVSFGNGSIGSPADLIFTRVGSSATLRVGSTTLAGPTKIAFSANNAGTPLIAFERDATGIQLNNNVTGAFTNLTVRSLIASETVTATNGYIFPLAATQVQLTNIVYTNTTLNFGSTATLTFTDLPVPIANLKSNDIVSINPPAISQTNGIFTAWISNTTCFARYHNYQATAIDPASGIFNVRVEQFK